MHIGDKVFEGDDFYGDGVNVASRMEPLAEVGGYTKEDKSKNDG
ncbi:MAG: hypothetical protein IIA58_02335 [Candidatus Marinimicrobia bacterium]|nr:hypothetical protein [Candidatus Neomarinimicrobiota bacterium]